MRNRELIAILNQQERNALGGSEYDLKNDRQEALDYYHGKHTGKLAAPEDPTRSSFISRDTMETILWVMPSLLRVFLTGRPVEFQAVGPEDEPLAEQESDVINHLFMKECDGFIVLYQWFWDALLQKNSYVHYYWEEKTRREVQTYSGLSDDELVFLVTELGFPTIIDGERKEDGWSVKFRVEEESGKLAVDVVPPEDVRVATTATVRASEAGYLAFRTYPTRTELIDRGFNKYIVKQIPRHIAPTSDEEGWHRATTYDETNKDEPVDKTTEQVELWTAYVRVDFDGDGKAELRRVVYAGQYVLENEEWDNIPVASLTPFILSHKHIGMSIHDIVKDLQEIRTSLTRMMLDNVYATAHNEMIVSDEKIVDINEWTQGVPGGLRRVHGDVSGSAMPNPNQPIAHRLLPMLDYFDIRKETRTGVGRATQGLDADVLKETTKGAYDRALKRSGEMIEAIARVFAETGVKDLFLGLHELMIKHQDKERAMKIHNQWVPVNPLEWKYRDNVTTHVGLGNDPYDEEVQKLMTVGMIQEKAAMAGVVQPQNVFSLSEDIVKKMGIEKQGAYFTDPKNIPPPQPQPNPLAEVEMIKQQGRLTAEQQKQQHQSQQDMMKAQQDAVKMLMESEEFRKQLAFDILELEVNTGTDLLKTGIGAELQREMKGDQRGRTGG